MMGWSLGGLKSGQDSNGFHNNKSNVLRCERCNHMMLAKFDSYPTGPINMFVTTQQISWLSGTFQTVLNANRCQEASMAEHG